MYTPLLYTHPGIEYIEYIMEYYNPPIDFPAILLDILRHVVQYHAITHVCLDICPPIISVEKKQSQRKKATSRASPSFIFIILHG